MRRLLIPALLLATPALAQQPTLQSNIDAGVAQVSRIVTGFGNEITAQAQQIDQMQRQMADMQKQLAAATKERDELKAAKPDAPK